MPKGRIESDRFKVLLPAHQVAELPPDYLSLTIDTSLVLGGHWWGNAKGVSRGVAIQTVAPIDLGDARLITFAKLLAPAMIRIGGTEADRVRYRIKKKKGQNRETSGADRVTEPDRELVLKKGIWKRINAFASKVGFKILFVVSAGPGQRDGKGAWVDSSARTLIAYTARKRLPVQAWELGNEVNGYPIIHGFRNRVSASRYVKDFARFSLLIRKLHPRALAVGPASAVIPAIGEPNPIIPALGRSDVMRPDNVISWHYYPQQSSRGRFANRRASKKMLLEPRHLDSVRKQARKIVKNARGRPVWMTETGHALYGGEPGQSDTYLSSIWWLDQLGLLAREGVSRVFRQSLVGSDYGLLDQGSFEPRPDYYASFLWKKLMGNRVFAAPLVEGADRKIRAYYQAPTRKSQSHCLLLVSLRDRHSLITVDGSIRRRYTVEPVDGICSSRIALNGVPVEEDLVFGWGKASTRKKYGVEGGRGRDGDSAPSEIDLPSYSYSFVLLRPGKSFLHG